MNLEDRSRWSLRRTHECYATVRVPGQGHGPWGGGYKEPGRADLDLILDSAPTTRGAVIHPDEKVIRTFMIEPVAPERSGGKGERSPSTEVRDRAYRSVHRWVRRTRASGHAGWVEIGPIS